MQNDIVDVAGGTFVITAISYATGIGYYNAVFRSINGKSDLFSVPLERILFEGGRQLAYITFYPVLILILAVLAFAILHIILKRYGIMWVLSTINWVKNLELLKIMSSFRMFLLFLGTISYASYAFYSAGEAGIKAGDSAKCVPGRITTEKGDFDGCILFKTDAEIWITVPQNGKSVLLNVPADKYLFMRIL